MTFIEAHCEDCRRFIKDDMVGVHRFLDQYAKMFPVMHFYDYHRTFLHNSYGLSLVKAMYGNEGENAFIVHIMRDYESGPIDHYTFEQIIKDFPRRLMWFNTMSNDYSPAPYVLRGWGGKSLITLATK